MNADEFLNILSPILEQLYKEYRLIDISAEFLSFVANRKMTEFKNILSDKKTPITEEDLKIYFQTLIDREISKSLDEEKSYLLLNNFINNKSKDPSSLKGDQILMQIGLLLNRFDYTPSAKFYEKLLNENDFLIKTLDSMAMINKTGELKDEVMDSLPIDINVQGLIDVYHKLKVANLENSQNGLLSSKETMELIVKAQCGDTVAKEKLVESNLRLVKSQANKFLGKGLDFEDLYQEGCIGLMKAITKFDVSKGFAFSTYAVPSIKFEIQNALSSNFKERTGTTHHLYHDTITYKNATEELQLALDRTPTLEEISARTKLSPQVIKTIENIESGPISLSTQLSHEEHFELEALLPASDKSPEDDTISSQFLKKFYELFESTDLNDIERKTLICEFGLFDHDKLTQSEISRQESFSREWIRKKHNSAIEKLRESPLLAEFNVYAENPDNCLQRINYFERQAVLAAKSKKKQKSRKNILS